MADEGIVEALFASVHVVDRHGDYTMPGFYGTQRDVAFGWNHAHDKTPVGRGDIEERNGHAIWTGRLNIKSKKGDDAFKSVVWQGKALDYSPTFDILPGGYRWLQPSERAEYGGAVRILQPLPDGSPGCVMREVSPVTLGAGYATGTLQTKSIDDEGKVVEPAPPPPHDEGGLTLAEHVYTTMNNIQALQQRVTKVDALRKEQGKTIGTASLERLAEYKEALSAAIESVDSVAPTTAPYQSDLDQSIEMLLRETDLTQRGY